VEPIAAAIGHFPSNPLNFSHVVIPSGIFALLSLQIEIS
jgi:hypothetical protein